jgi:hypothetical protein
METRNSFLKGAVFTTAALVLSVVGLSACLPVPGLGKLDDAKLAFYPQKNLDTAGATGLDAFTSIMVPLFANAKCTSCHTTQAPQFASSDKMNAYSSARTALNLVTPASSKLVSKAGDGHCDPTCQILPSATWITAVEQWAEAENRIPTEDPGPGTVNPGPVVSVDGPPAFVTSTLLLGATRLASAETFSLAARGAAFANVSFVVTVTDPAPGVSNAAQFAKVQLVNRSASPVLVEGIRIFQSADSVVDPANPADYKIDTGKAYTQVSAVVAPNSSATLGTAEVVLDKADGLYVAFGFQKLEVSALKTCKAQTYFNTNVGPVMNTSCMNCHGATAGNAGARTAWTMSTNMNTLCSQALQQADLNSPINSSVIQRPFYGASGHPNVGGLNDTILDRFVEWITRER